ncbi:MAG: winged helix-turn-helix transcriptional regulator [Thermoplasmatota archaeon]
MARALRLAASAIAALALLAPLAPAGALDTNPERGPPAAGLPGYPGAGEGGASPRTIVVISDNVSITLARGTFESGLLPFPELDTGLGRVRVDEPLDLTGQLVDGNFTLLSHGGGREAALRNHGVAGHGEVVRWWFQGEEQPPLPVAWNDPSKPDGSVNGTFFVRGWVPDRRLAPRAGVYEMRFSFDGTRAFFQGLGELQLYPPAELLVRVEVLFPTLIELLEPSGAVDAGSVARIAGRVRGSDGVLPGGAVRATLDGCTLGPPLPPGLYIDEVEVVVPGIPYVLFREGFESGWGDWSHGGEGDDWGVGRPSAGPAPYSGLACLGTNLSGSYAHLADEWVRTPVINLTGVGADVRLTFARWMELANGDCADVLVWNGTVWSDPVRLSGPEGEWGVVSIELSGLTSGGAPMGFSDADELAACFRLRSSTPSARVLNGAFELDWSVPRDAPPSHSFLTVKFISDGPYAPSFAYLRVDVRAVTRFEIPEGAARVSAGGWVEIQARLVDSRGLPPELPPGPSGGGTIEVIWSDDTGSAAVESVTGLNSTGHFAAAHRRSSGEMPGSGWFRLRFRGTESHQAAEATALCALNGSPLIELDAAGPAPAGGELVIRGGLLLDGAPLPARPIRVRLPFEPFEAEAVTDAEGRFSFAIPVPGSYPGEAFEALVTYEGDGGELAPAATPLHIQVSRALRIIFDGGTWVKGRGVETWLGELRFSGVAGRVEDETGRPVAGASVALEAQRPGGREILGRARTDASGHFSIPHFVSWSESTGALSVSAVASLPPSAPARREAVFNITAATMVLLDPLPALSTGASVEVTGVLRESWGGAPGDPVASAYVVIRMGGREFRALTDHGGHFRVNFTVIEGSGSHSLLAEFAPEAPMEQFLAPSHAAIVVEVRAAAPGAPAPAPPAPAPASGGGRAVAAASLLSAALAAIAIVGAETSRYKLLTLLVPLYSKIRREEVLDQFVRGQVFGYIQANPGDHYSSIRQTLRLKNGTLSYHLRTLEREGFIFSRMDGVYRRFYPMGTDPARVALRRGVRETHKRIMELIEQKPGVTPKELAVALGTSHQVASYHVRVLSRRGSIRLEQRGRNTLCYPSGGPARGPG